MVNTVSNLDEQVRESIRARIVSGDLAGGAHLSELRLSKEFSVSRTPIREALCALAADGLIEMVPHRGAFVTTVNESESEDQNYVYSNFMAMAARMASERVGIESMMDLENAINNLNTGNLETFMQGCETVNTTIRTIAQSTSLETSIAMLERRMITSPMWVETEEQMKAISQEYTYLMGAFKRKKADAAEKTMRQLMGMFGSTSETTASTENSEAIN